MTWALGGFSIYLSMNKHTEWKSSSCNHSVHFNSDGDATIHSSTLRLLDAFRYSTYLSKIHLEPNIRIVKLLQLIHIQKILLTISARYLQRWTMIFYEIYRSLWRVEQM